MDRFIVGTGRCGSTLLWRMLAQPRSFLRGSGARLAAVCRAGNGLLGRPVASTITLDDRSERTGTAAAMRSDVSRWNVDSRLS